MCICLRVCVCLVCMDVPLEDRRGHQIPRARAVGSHKLPDTGTVNWAWVLGNSSKCSWWLSHFSSPCRLDLNFYHIFIYLLCLCVKQVCFIHASYVCVRMYVFYACMCLLYLLYASQRTNYRCQFSPSTMWPEISSRPSDVAASVLTYWAISPALQTALKTREDMKPEAQNHIHPFAVTVKRYSSLGNHVLELCLPSVLACDKES